MKKRMMTWLLVLLAALTLTVPSFAEQTEDDLLIYDAAELLNEDEWLELELLADEITWRYNCAVYIVTIPDYEDYGDSPYNAAANIYNTQDFGIGEERSGVLLMLSTWDRDYALYIRDGYAKSMIGKYALSQLEDEFLDNFANDDWQGGFEDYLKWLSAAAPDLRKQTGTECAGAIQRYSQLTVTTESTPTEWMLTLGNFVDEGWLFFRANEGTPGRVTGGELTNLTGNLYLLKANADTIHIEKKGA